MVHGKLVVDSDALLALSTQVCGISEKLENTAGKVDSYQSGLGANNVQTAVSGFEDHWGRGRRRIKEKSEALSAMLADSADNYVATDDGVAGALQREESALRVGR